MADSPVTGFFVPDLLEEAVSAGFAGVKALAGTGAAILKPGMPGGTVGTKVNVPYFSLLGEFDDVATDGTALVPAALTSAATAATVAQGGKAFSLTDWAAWAAAGDPYVEGAAQLVEGARRKIDAKLIAAATAANAPMTEDGAAGAFTYDGFVNAIGKFGDEQNDIACAVMHSGVVTQIRKLKDTANRPIFVDAMNGNLPQILGIPIVISNQMPFAATVYTTAIIKKGALVAWYKQPTVESARDILSAKTNCACHLFYAVHRYTHMPGLANGGVALYTHK